MSAARACGSRWAQAGTRLLAAWLVLALVGVSPTEAASKSSRKAAPRPATPAATTPVARAEACPPPSAEQAFAATPYAVFRDCADTPEMVSLPGGRFRMGELGDVGLSYERPIREVTIAPFALGKYELTFLEWDACHADGFCQKQPDDLGWGRGFHPVINVSWLDAQQYVTWLSRKTGQVYRLPSEAEWEYAARAGTETSYPWGESQASTCDYANALDIVGHNLRPNWFWSVYCIDGYAFTAPVGSYPPNAWGLYDLQGNVWEWVQDCWHNDYTGAPLDGSAWISGGDCSKRANRGGGWGNHPRTLRVAKRDADSATGYGDAFGFRVVRELPVTDPLPAAPTGSGPAAARQDASTTEPAPVPLPVPSPDAAPVPSSAVPEGLGEPGPGAGPDS